jgi:uncharacterized protein YkwD
MTAYRFDARAAAREISRYRRGRGLPAVSLDPQLTAMAQEKAKLMAAGRGINHDGFVQRLEASGFDPMVAGENIGAGAPTFDVMFSMWQDSSVHDAILLLKDANRLGIVVVHARRTKYKTFWAMVIAAPMPAERRREAVDPSAWPPRLPIGEPPVPRWKRWVSWVLK